MTDKITKEEKSEYKKLLEDIRSDVTKNGEEGSEAQKKMTERMDKLEEKAQKETEELLEAKKEAEEFKEKIEGLEKKLYRADAGSEEEEKAKAEMKSFDLFLRKGAQKISEDELKYLRQDVNTEGGYLSPEDMQNEIIKQITETTPMRSVARVIQTSRQAISIPKRTSLANGSWIGEGEDFDESQSNYGSVMIPLNKLAVQTHVTTELLTDSVFNVEGMIQEDISENFGQLEGAAFLNGDPAANQPEGFLNKAGVQKVDGLGSAVLNGDDFFALQGELKTGYNGTFMMNRRTIAKARTLKGSNGQYLFAAGLNSGTPNTIAGDPFVSAIDMPDIAVGDTPVAYADWNRFYVIVDGVVITFLRDPFTKGGAGKVRFIAHKRVGGRVVQEEAGKLLEIQA